MKLRFSVIACVLLMPYLGLAQHPSPTSDHSETVTQMLQIIAAECDDSLANNVMELASEALITRRDSGYGEVSCTIYYVGRHISVSECRSGATIQEYSLRTSSSSKFGKRLLVLRNEGECREL